MTETEVLTEDQMYNRLEQRRNWLTERIKAKETVGWETIYDKSECNSLTWALGILKEVIDIKKPG